MFPFPFSFFGGASGPPELELIDNDFAMEFNGTDEYITTGDTVGGGDFSLSYWVNANGSYAAHTRFHPVSIQPSNNYPNQSIGCLCTKGVTLYPTLQAYDSTDTTFTTWSARALDFIGAGWRHVVWTFNTTTKATYVYVDGVVQTFTHYSSGATTAYLISRGMTYSNLNIGATWIPSEYFGGDVDEVAVWSRELDATEVETIYDSTNDNPGKCANLFTGGLGTDLVFWNRMGD